MKIIITENYEELSTKAFEPIKGIVKSNPYAVLGLATGTTPLGLYRHIIEDHKTHGTSYAHIRTVNLDDYKGLPKDHPQSYAYFMRENLFRHLDNIAITGDCDALIVCQNDNEHFSCYCDGIESQEKYSYKSINSTLDERKILLIAAEILDGGKEAIRKRVRKI